MSRDALLNSTDMSVRSPAQRILMALKMRGPQTAADLGKKLATTGEAVRQQLVRLAEDDLVVARSESRGVGRPSQIWALTSQGGKQFPDTHADLTVQLLSAIRTQLGDAALEAVIAVRESETRASYRAEMQGTVDIREKLTRLAQIRTAEGYMAEWQQMPDGRLLFIENHCPICAAAAVCQGFCRAELDIFRDVLGSEVVVERTEHTLSGARRCAYEVRT